MVLGRIWGQPQWDRGPPTFGDSLVVVRCPEKDFLLASTGDRKSMRSALLEISKQGLA